MANMNAGNSSGRCMPTLVHAAGQGNEDLVRLLRMQGSVRFCAVAGL